MLPLRPRSVSGTRPRQAGSAHCWTGLDHIHEQQLCRLCGRDARAAEDKHEDWRAPDEQGDFLCPECHVAGEDSVKVQLVKNAVRRWQRTGTFPTGYRALIDRALSSERKIVMRLLQSQVELERASPTGDEWEQMVSRAVQAAKAAWPEPVGEQQDS